METNKVVKVKPLRGGWQGFYTKLKRKPWMEMEITLVVTPEMYKNPPAVPEGMCAEDMARVITFKGSYHEDKKVFISSMIQQRSCDADVYGMEPDEFLCGVVSHDGVFLSLLD